MTFNQITAFAISLLLFAGFWLLLTRGEAASWIFGAPVVLATSVWFARRRPAAAIGIRPWRLVIFVPYFISRSLDGSIDVAWRALHPRMPIDPQIYRYHAQISSDSSAGVFFANCMNLLPGTLSVDQQGEEVHVHMLTATRQGEIDLVRLERQVALLFGLPWNANREIPR